MSKASEVDGWSEHGKGIYSSKQGMAGYNELFMADIDTNNYVVSADILWMGTGDSGERPLYGIYALYQDEENYVLTCFDKSLNELYVHAVIKGSSKGWFGATLPDSFDYSTYHNLRVKRDGHIFKFYVDGKFLQQHLFCVNSGQLGLVTQDTSAQFRNVTIYKKPQIFLDKVAICLPLGKQAVLSPNTWDSKDRFIWSSSDDGVVVVKDGVVKAVGEGYATISVASEIHRASIESNHCIITVPKVLPPGKFKNPIAYRGEDPWIIDKNGLYFYSYVKQTNKGVFIKILKTNDFTKIGQEEGLTVWAAPETGWNNHSAWAPELHHIDGKWYIYYAGCDKASHENRRMGVLESLTDDPMGPYIDKGKLIIPQTYSDRWEFEWAIDGTVLEKDGKLYFIWSGWPDGKPADSEQVLFMAPMCNPWTLSGDRILLSKPEYPWEKSVRGINEGPQVLQREGRIFIIYSANASWTNEYCLGLLCLTGEDILDPASWTKYPDPVFYKDPQNHIYGPGHNSFVKSPDGSEDWVVYHVSITRTSGWGREIRTQKFTWDDNGAPLFGKPVPIEVLLDKPSGTKES